MPPFSRILQPRQGCAFFVIRHFREDQNGALIFLTFLVSRTCLKNSRATCSNASQLQGGSTWGRLGCTPPQVAAQDLLISSQATQRFYAHVHVRGGVGRHQMVRERRTGQPTCRHSFRLPLKLPAAADFRSAWP